MNCVEALGSLYFITYMRTFPESTQIFCSGPKRSPTGPPTRPYARQRRRWRRRWLRGWRQQWRRRLGRRARVGMGRLRLWRRCRNGACSSGGRERPRRRGRRWRREGKRRGQWRGLRRLPWRRRRRQRKRRRRRATRWRATRPLRCVALTPAHVGRWRVRVVARRRFGPTSSSAGPAAATSTVAADGAADELVRPTSGRAGRVRRWGMSGSVQWGQRSGGEATARV